MSFLYEPGVPPLAASRLRREEEEERILSFLLVVFELAVRVFDFDQHHQAAGDAKTCIEETGKYLAHSRANAQALRQAMNRVREHLTPPS